MRSNRFPGRVGWAVVLGAIALIALNLAWLHHYRPEGLVTEYDESGYLAIALDDARGLRDGGLTELARVFARQAHEAPLVPLTAVPGFLLLGDSVQNGLAAVTLWLACLGLLTYALARVLVGPGWAALAAFTAVTAPEILDFSRLFHFSVPAAGAFTGAALCLVRSRRLRAWPWLLGAGASLGAMVLARTMTVAFLPGFLLVGLLWIVLDGEERRERVLRGLLVVVAGAAVAGPWYARNYRDVGSYLLHAGYGTASAAYGSAHSPLSVGYWTREGRALVTALYAPLALAVIASAGLGLRALTRRPRRGPDLRALALGPGGALLVLLVEGYVALSSSRNNGTGFSVPLVPTLVVLSVAVCARAAPARLRVVLLGLFAGAGSLTLATKTLDVSAAHTEAVIRVPGWGRVPVVDGASEIWNEVQGAGYPAGPPGAPLPKTHRGWLPTASRLARTVVAGSAPGATPIVAMGSGDPILSGTRIQLVSRLDQKHPIATVSLRSFPDGDTVPSYRRQLRASDASFLVTGAPPPVRDDSFHLSRARVEAAGRSLGFRRIALDRTPDGRPVELWRRLTRATPASRGPAPGS